MRIILCPHSQFSVWFLFYCTWFLSFLERGGAEDSSEVIAMEMQFIKHSLNAWIHRRSTRIGGVVSVLTYRVNIACALESPWDSPVKSGTCSELTTLGTHPHHQKPNLKRREISPEKKTICDLLFFDGAEKFLWILFKFRLNPISQCTDGSSVYRSVSKFFVWALHE